MESGSSPAFHRQGQPLYALPDACQVEIVLRDLSGRIAGKPVREFQPAGWHTLNLSERGLRPGFDLVNFTAGEFRRQGKVVLTE